ncbi:sulfatase-like hydrolase/transferase [Pedobacter sp. NJ-S-72]
MLASKKNKILIVLHTSTSHGPTYSKKYPPRFETFKPVCNSVELGNCSQKELINAYDNTIIYTDYILHNVIEDLKQLKEYKSAMLFVSDHGESLGEKNLYMHGLPLSMAPKEQYEIPFIVWVSDSSKQLKPNKMLSQYHVFHSVLNFLGVQSPIYDEKMNIFK